MAAHDEVCEQAVQAFAETDLAAVTAAFVASLSSRNLPARSAFGSFIVLQHFVPHDFVESSAFASGLCAHCGLPRRSDTPCADERLMRYPFQVQHTDIQYAAYDLATFKDRVVEVPSAEDRRRLQAMFHAIYTLSSLPAAAQLGELNKALQGTIRSNKLERTILLETFGYAGILCPRDQQNYTDGFVAYDFANLQQPQSFYKREWAYPIRFWTGGDGVHEDKLRYYFSAFL